ncbi:MAG: penicillin-binding protein 2 [Betaproteobacteria bacterium]|jgi:penicillin-binding protein 2|nr:penicillin-binding protein 2 [Betaproteobacteria bacterium]
MKTFNDPAEYAGRFYIRLLAAVLFVFVGWILLAYTLYSLQIKNYDRYQTLAEGNRISILPIVPQRGNIVDRNGVTLARNFVAYTLEITPSFVVNVDKTIDGLSEFIAIEQKDRQRFKKFFRDNRRLDSAPIRTRLSDEEVARFMGQRYRFPGVDVQARLFRDYPNGTLGSHLIGYISRISDRDVEEIEGREDADNYLGSMYIGKSGVEATHEADLHGMTGREHVENTAGGKVVRSLKREEATPGSDIELSIDIELQKVAETAFGERRGGLVAIDPSTGEVLALVSMPTFDPNLFVDGISSQDWNVLNEVGVPKEKLNKPLLNRAVASAYPPGSTFKPFMALAGLNSGKRTLTYKMNDPGGFSYGGHYFKDDKKGGHGSVDIYKSIVVSCNTFYYVLANDLGIDTIANFIGQFGLGALSGIDIPDEKEGVLPSTAWKRKRFAKHGREHQKWYGGETISVGIGQGYNAYTPVQMASAIATIANDGKRMRPRVARATIDSHGKREEYPSELVKEISVDPEFMAAVQRALGDVTRFGTATRAFAGAPYRAAGKTGTAQVYSLKGQAYDKSDERKRDHSWFIAYAPVEQPRIALAVMVENGGFGAVSAAPIARQVIDAFLLEKRADKPAPEDAGAETEEEGGDDHPGNGAHARQGENAG